MAIRPNVKIDIFPRQRDFIFSQEDEAFYGGAAGGGKSHALLIFAALRRQKYPKTTGLLLRRTYPELERSLILKSHELYPQFGAKYNEQKHRWHFPNGSIQEFGFCDRDKDVYKYQGAEYHDEGFDELTHFSEFQFSYITSRCRSVIPGVRALIRTASNPGNIGHVWVKNRYIVPWRVNRKWKNPVSKRTMTFIPAKVQDNPALMVADPFYLDRLKELGDKKYRALALGDWDIFEGQYFTEWDGQPNMSVLSKHQEPELSTKKIICLDWGFAEPAAVYWLEIFPYGRIHVYRELYTTLRGPQELAKDILELTSKLEKIQHMVIPPELYGKKVETEGGGEPIADLMAQVLGQRILLKKANNARVPGWLKLRQFLSKAPDGFPWLQVSPKCENLIRTLPALIHDEDRPEDLDGDGEDHAADSLRYGVVDIHDLPKNILSPHKPFLDSIFDDDKKPSPRVSFIPSGKGRGGYGNR